MGNGRLRRVATIREKRLPEGEEPPQSRGAAERGRAAVPEGERPSREVLLQEFAWELAQMSTWLAAQPWDPERLDPEHRQLLRQLEETAAGLERQVDRVAQSLSGSGPAGPEG